MADRPNIVFITSHDSGRHFGCYGVPTVHTPVIDQLASEGVQYTQAFCAATVCSPSRAATMSGRWPQSNGVMGLVHPPSSWRYNADEKHLSQLLLEAGYRTHLFYFQHETTTPEQLGFESLHGQLPPTPPDTMRDPYEHRPAREVVELFEEFCDSEKESPERPFYAQVGFFETHRPFDFDNNSGDDSKGVYVPPVYDQEDEKLRRDFMLLQGSIRSLDQAVGSILASLEKHGLRDNTLVVFTTDHGIPMPRAKGTMYDLGIEVPLIWSWPAGGLSGGRVCNSLVSQVDVLPTMFEMLDIPIHAGVQGQSFLLALQGENNEFQARECVFSMLDGSRAARTDSVKLIRNFLPGRSFALPVRAGGPKTHQSLPFAELYDLQRDPAETENLADDPAYKQIRRHLEQRLLDHMRNVEDPLLQGPTPPPYYLAAREDFFNVNGLVNLFE